MDSFNLSEYANYFRLHWRLPLMATISAAAIALIACLILPKQYTATATIVIEPPGGDARTAISVSPIYLESLKSYETFAASDSLFSKACEKFHLLNGSPLESFKKRVLRVEKPKDTKVLEIGVTLPDPKLAQAVAQYLAEQAVALDRSVARTGDQEVLDDAEQKLEAARTELNAARVEVANVTKAGSELILESEAQSLTDLKEREGVERIDANSLIAESVARGDEETAAGARARLKSLNTDLASIQTELDAKSAALAGLRARRDQASNRLHSAEEAFEIARKRDTDVSAGVKFRSGQLRIVDPGIVPERPSFPNLPLAVAAAIIIAAAACLAWMTLQFGLSIRREPPARAGLRVAGSGAR
jgi:uncharacterized protein involved in exopolysaccharide biosynthesis